MIDFPYMLSFANANGIKVTVRPKMAVFLVKCYRN